MSKVKSKSATPDHRARVRAGGWASKPAKSKAKRNGGREVVFGRRRAASGKLVPASYRLPANEAVADMRATRIKVALYVTVKSEHGRTWPVAADAAARAIAAGEQEDVVGALIARAFGSASPAARSRESRGRPPEEVEQAAADDAVHDPEDVVVGEPPSGVEVAEASSAMYATVAAYSAAAEKRQGHGLDPVEVVSLWASVQARKAEGDPVKSKSVTAETGRMNRVATWSPDATVFDSSLDVARINSWKSNIVAAADDGHTTEPEAKKAVGLLATLLQWGSESKRVAWSLPDEDDDGVTWRDALRLRTGFGRGMNPRPWWGSELASMFKRARGQWVEAPIMLALNLGATQADFGVITGSDVEKIGDRWFISYTRAKIVHSSTTRVRYPLWPETVATLKAVGAWERVGDDVPLLTLPSGAAINKDNLNSRHWGPLRQAMEAAGEVRKARGQGDNGYRNLRRTGAQRIYCEASVSDRLALSKAWLQHELIGGATGGYILGQDSPLVRVVDAVGTSMRSAGVFGGKLESETWGRENIAAELSSMMTAAD